MQHNVIFHESMDDIVGRKFVILLLFIYYVVCLIKTKKESVYRSS